MVGQVKEQVAGQVEEQVAGQVKEQVAGQVEDQVCQCNSSITWNLTSFAVSVPFEHS